MNVTKKGEKEMSLKIEQLENINKALITQRDEAEVKVKLLTLLIDDDLWCCLDAEHEKLATDVMKKIGV